MKPRKIPSRLPLLGGLVLIASATGCQLDVGGQTPPRPFYLQDYVQYFAPGPEFKLSREAAAQKAARGEEMSRQQP